MEKIDLKEEVICDYKVSNKMKKVWQCELDMLEEVDRICKKHNITYFLAGGTLLGAIRHGGFIPWDDDIDLNMKRNDYNKFLEIAQEELGDKYFLQYFKSEKKYNRGHAQIRNSSTTAIIKYDKHNLFNKGIFIDIFPLDNLPNNKEERDIFIKKVTKKKKYLDDYYNLDCNNFIKQCIKRIIFKLRYLFVDYDKKIEEYEDFVSLYKDNDTKFIGPISFNTSIGPFQTKDFNDVKYMKFEYMQAPCPIGYDEVLREQYGAYMKIPENKNGTIHGGIYFDLENSYKEYIKNDNKKLLEKYFRENC